MRESVALVERTLPVDNSPYLTTICHAINFFITGVYLWAAHTPAVNLSSPRDSKPSSGVLRLHQKRLFAFFSPVNSCSQNAAPGAPDVLHN